MACLVPVGAPLPPKDKHGGRPVMRKLPSPEDSERLPDQNPQLVGSSHPPLSFCRAPATSSARPSLSGIRLQNPSQADTVLRSPKASPENVPLTRRTAK